MARVEHGGAWLTALVRSVDVQTLDTGAFEIVFVVADANSHVAAQLHQLSTRRPNVRVLTEPADGDLVSPVASDWILDLGRNLPTREPKLFPQALQRLLDFGEETGCDVVLGRTIAEAQAPTLDLFVADRPQLERGVDPETVRSALVLRRRASAQGTDVGSGAVVTDQKVAVLASYACARLAPIARIAQSSSTQLAEVTYAWSEGRIVITATGTVQNVPADPTVLLSVGGASVGGEFRLPCRSEIAADGSFTATAELDVRTAALGTPLPTGVWQLWVAVHGSAGGWATPAALPAAALRAGIVDGRPVVPKAAESALSLDVGATKHSIVGKVAASAVTVAETAQGSLMTMRLDVAVHGQSRRRGAVWMGDFDIPAFLITDATSAYIECYLSGLPGSSPLATKFGAGKPVPTGLTVTASPTGIFTVAKSAKHAPGARGAPRSSTTAASSMPLSGGPAAFDRPASRPRPTSKTASSSSRATRLRDKVPAPLEPLVQTLSRSPLARRMYRKVAGITEPKR